MWGARHDLQGWLLSKQLEHAYNAHACCGPVLPSSHGRPLAPGAAGSRLGALHVCQPALPGRVRDIVLGGALACCSASLVLVTQACVE